MASAVSHRKSYPLYNTTLTLHRLSTLYTGHDTLLDSAALQTYARQFRDILVGDVLRGVRVGLGSDEDVLARVGALQTVTWRVLVEEDSWDYTTGDESALDEITDSTSTRGLYLTIVYERATYMAVLLRSQGREEYEARGFHHYPLLLTRMPSTLRDTFTEFLESTFDARISVLRMNQLYLPLTLETYIENCLKGEDGEEVSFAENSGILKKILKEVQVVVGFRLPTDNASLKSIDIVIARDDLPRFIQSGNKVHFSSKAQTEEQRKMPFLDALTLYLHTHLALNLRSEDVIILRVACGAFVLGSEGKLKLTEPLISGAESAQGRATAMLVNGLIEHAEGQEILKSNHIR